MPKWEILAGPRSKVTYTRRRAVMRPASAFGCGKKQRKFKQLGRHDPAAKANNHCLAETRAPCALSGPRCRKTTERVAGRAHRRYESTLNFQEIGKGAAVMKPSHKWASLHRFVPSAYAAVHFTQTGQTWANLSQSRPLVRLRTPITNIRCILPLWRFRAARPLLSRAGAKHDKAIDVMVRGVSPVADG